MSLEGFTAAEITHISNITLDYFIKSPLFQNGIQEKPLLAKMEGGAKAYKGAKEKISIGVKGERGAGGTNDGVTGFSHDDTVNFYNPGNALRANYIWREHHIGTTHSETQLKTQGILVGDEFAKNVRRNGDPGLVILSDYLEEANADFMEQYAKTMNDLMWDDGTTDTSALHGLRAFVQDIPTIGTVGGLNAATHTWWRNRARTAAFLADGSYDAAWGGGAVTSTPANGGALLQILQSELRQLRRYGGKPDCFFAGSDFIEAMEVEMRANGYYSDTGFTKAQDGGMGEMKFKKLDVIYDPTLDDLGLTKRAYIWDSSDVYLRPLEGDWKRVRNPARPYNQFILHRSMVCTGQMVARRRDSSLVIDIA